MSLAGYHQIQQKRNKHQIYTKYTRISYLNPITFNMICYHFFRFNCIARQTEAAETQSLCEGFGQEILYTALMKQPAVDQHKLSRHPQLPSTLPSFWSKLQSWEFRTFHCLSSHGETGTTQHSSCQQVLPRYRCTRTWKLRETKSAQKVSLQKGKVVKHDDTHLHLQNIYGCRRQQYQVPGTMAPSYWSWEERKKVALKEAGAILAP